MDTAKLAYRAGAICYLLWGLLHIYAAWLSYTLADGTTDSFVGSKLQQNGWNLAFLSIVCIYVAIRLNWRNSRLGFWINAIMVSATDIGFIVLILLPGIATDLLGPILWLLGLAGTAYGIVRAPGTA